MTALLDELPTEIVELIIFFVSEAGVKDLAPLLQVCRKWHDLGLPLLWQDIVLTKSNISSFSTTITQYPHLAGRPRSLTLDIQLSYDEYSLTYKVAEYIKRLTKVLPSMRHLTTFSLAHYVDQSSPYPSSAMTNDMIMGLVSALPSSVRNLEIDSAVMYFTQHTGSHCLCSMLSKILPYLRSLRLAYPRICSKLFDNPSSTLQYLVINGIMQHFRPGIRGCDVAGEQARLSWDALQEQRITTSIATVKDLLRAVQERVLCQSTSNTGLNPTFSTVFPSLKSLVVLEPYYFIPNDSLDFFLTNVHSITPQEGGPTSSTRIVSQCFPTWMDNLYQYFVLRQCVHSPPRAKPRNFTTSISSSTTTSLTSCDHRHPDTCAHHDIAGSFTELRTMLEGTAGWTTTAHNARCPQYLIQTPLLHNKMSQLQLQVEAKVEVVDSFERWQQQQQQQQQQVQERIDDEKHQQYLYRTQSQVHPRLAWSTVTPGNSVPQPVYTVFRCLDGFSPSEADLVRRVSLDWCRCQKCQRSRQRKRDAGTFFATATSTGATAITNHNNSRNGIRGSHRTWEDDDDKYPTPVEHFFANQIWRAEGDLQQTLLCGREYYHGNAAGREHYYGNDGSSDVDTVMPEDLRPADFKLAIKEREAGVIL